MIPGEFDYFSPTTLDEAVALLTQHGSDAKLLAGGHSLIPAMRFRLATPQVLIDLNGIPGLEAIEERDGHLVIGAMARESAIDESELIRQKYPLLSDTSRVIADPLVRNRGTIGGNVAHADPANDHPATMLAYDARFVAVGPGGTRTIPVDEFFVDLFETSLAEDEVLTEIHIPTPKANSGGAYVKMERKVGDYAVAAVAAQVTMDGQRCVRARISLTNVNIVPMRARGAEEAMTGQIVTEEVLEAAGQAAAAECDPSPDLRGTVEYKRDLVRVLVKRAIRKAIERAEGAPV